MVNQHTNIKVENEAVAKDLSLSMAVCTKKARWLLTKIYSQDTTETNINIEKGYYMPMETQLGKK